MKKLHLPPLPAEVDKERLKRICSPKLCSEDELVKSEARLKETSQNPASSIYEKATAQICVNGSRKNQEEVFKSENERYKSRFNVTIDEDEKKAMSGQNRALFRLIAWDKRRLFNDWIKPLPSKLAERE